MNENEKVGQPFSKAFRQTKRIDTQIHRRRKVNVFSPLECEWESSEAGSSSCEVMTKAKSIRHLVPDRELRQQSNGSTDSPLPDHLP